MHWARIWVVDTKLKQKEPRPRPYGGKASRLRRFLRRRPAAHPTPWTSRLYHTKLPLAFCPAVPCPWFLPPPKSHCKHLLPTTICSRPASYPHRRSSHSLYLLRSRSRRRVRHQPTSKSKPRFIGVYCIDHFQTKEAHLPPASWPFAYQELLHQHGLTQVT